MEKENLVKQICNIIINNCQDDTSYNDNTLYDYIMHGFKGLNNMSVSELKAELKSLTIE
jgi:hypothetical protein